VNPDGSAYLKPSGFCLEGPLNFLWVIFFGGRKMAGGFFWDCSLSFRFDKNLEI
jgi:hypothetical protein